MKNLYINTFKTKILSKYSTKIKVVKALVLRNETYKVTRAKSSHGEIVWPVILMRNGD